MKQKMKTKKAAAKRFSLTATGKVKYKAPGLRHNTGLKSGNNNRNLRNPRVLCARDAGLLERCFPYGLK